MGAQLDGWRPSRWLPPLGGDDASEAKKERRQEHLQAIEDRLKDDQTDEMMELHDLFEHLKRHSRYLDNLLQEPPPSPRLELAYGMEEERGEEERRRQRRRGNMRGDSGEARKRENDGPMDKG